MILCLELPSEMTAQMLMSQPNRKRADYYADWKCADTWRTKVIVLHRALVVSKRDLIASLKRQLSDSKARWNNCHMHMTLLASLSMILCFRRAKKMHRSHAKNESTHTHIRVPCSQHITSHILLYVANDGSFQMVLCACAAFWDTFHKRANDGSFQKVLCAPF